MTYQEYAKKFARKHVGSNEISTIRMVPRLHCSDGFSMSVQASYTHYCSPRNSQGPWESFEVGFPSDVEPKLMPHAEDPDDPTDTVYSCVPAELVEEICADHGGIAAPCWATLYRIDDMMSGIAKIRGE
jgi:hypothetical protein